MPFKHNSARRHRIPRAQYRVRNWPQYDAGLRRRGDLTLWLDEAALAGWQAPRRTTPGGQARYSDLAIELVLMLRLVFQLALRQAEGFVGSVLRLCSSSACRTIGVAGGEAWPGQPVLAQACMGLSMSSVHRWYPGPMVALRSAAER